MREPEFLPDWYPKVRKRKRTLALQAWITLILISGLGLWMLLVQRNVRAREVALGALRTDLTQSETELERLEDAQQLQRDLGRRDEIFHKIGRPIESTRLLTTLEHLMPKDMALLDLALEGEDPAPRGAGGGGGSLAARAQQDKQKSQQASKLNFRMHGIAPTDVALAEFLAKLTAKPFFKQVELMYAHERLDSGHVMREFEVTFAMDLTGLGGK
jgi:Tfp pilus assembly protein PilN